MVMPGAVVHKSLWGHINRQANKPECHLTSNRVASVRQNGRQEIENSQHSEIRQDPHMCTP